MAATATSESRDAVRESLRQFVTTVCRDVVFRRKLRYEPAQALKLWGLETDQVPQTLPVRHYEISVTFDDRVLFGPPYEDGFDGLSLPLEARLVLYGLKPMALLQTNARETVRVLRACAHYNLTTILSPFEFTPVTDSTANGYLNVAVDRRPAGATLQNWRSVIVARDSRQVKLGWLSLLFGWDDFLGILLGYPSCCVESFSRNWRIACERFSGEVGAVLLDAEAHIGQPVVKAAHCCMNLFARYFGFHLTEHFPCSFQCEATARLGDRLLRGLGEFEKEFASQIAAMLSSPVLFAFGDGACLFPDAAWDHQQKALRYSRVMLSNTHSNVAHRLASAHQWSSEDGGTLMTFPTPVC